AGSLDELANRLAAVAPGRLLIIAGDEVHASDAAAEVARMAETLGAEVYGSSWPSRLPFPTAHPLWAGNMPNKGRDIYEMLTQYDAIFALGGKSLITILYSSGPIIPKSCVVYQMSTDVRDLGRTYATELSVVGDIRASLRALQPVLEKATEPRRDVYDALCVQAAERRAAHRAALAARAASEWDAPKITPLVAAQEAARAIGPDISIVDEAIATSMHLRGFLNSRSSNQYSFLRGGALGWGMPAAVGCSLGLGRQPVVSLVGDGAALYSPQAIWTAAHEKLPVTFVVMNNREYNILKNFMKGQKDYLSTRSNRYIAMDIGEPAIDYLALAASYGLPARRVERPEDVAPAIEAGIACGTANLVEIMIGVE
ncbi:MAG TPA: thiamine pyrophosphate-dependent enzyme, partial [Acidisoma sp.]|uniref:thiamine pyrophosphate-dependent enzyme n=1 Tax=Acidisoma sp. TaxID=1872115 RepID=UPI002C8DA279